MSKTITLTYEGKDYTLEFTRKSVERMEATGFRIEDVGNKPMTAIPMLWKGSFLAHHKNVKEYLINKMYEQIRGKDEFFDKLTEMYVDTVESLFDEPESDEGNLEWGANW